MFVDFADIQLFITPCYAALARLNLPLVSFLLSTFFLLLLGV